MVGKYMRSVYKRGIALVLASALVAVGMSDLGLTFVFPSVMGSPTVSFAAPSDFDINVPELHAAPFNDQEAKVLEGTSLIRQIIDQVYYRDIDRVYGRKAIVRMTAIGVINNFGSRFYRPTEGTTGYEAVSDILSLLGEREAIVQKVVDNGGTNASSDLLSSMFRKECLAKARAMGIVLDSEIVGLESPIDKEQAALFLSRALNKGGNPSISSETPQLFSFSDWQDIEPYARQAIEFLVREDIAKLTADGRFSAHDTLSRAELATWISGAFDRTPTIHGGEIGYGLVVGKHETTSREGDEVVRTRVVDIVNPAGEPVRLVSTSRSGSLLNDYVVYKNGIISASDFLEKGDEIEYITIDGVLCYVGEIPNGQVLAELGKEPDIYSYTHYGTLVAVKTEEYFENDRKGMKERYRVTDITGDTFDIVVKEDALTGQRSDIIVSKNGMLGGVKLLEIGDTLEYITNDLSEVSYIKVGDLERKSLSGTVNKFEPATESTPAYLTIFTYEGDLIRYPLAPYALLMINSRGAKPQDFVYGLDIHVDVARDLIIAVLGDSYSGEPGYIPPFGKMRMGTVTTKGRKSFQLSMANGAVENISVDSTTMFTKNGEPADFISIKPGQKVKVYFDTMMMQTASKVDVQAPEKLFDKIYKGKIENIVPQTGELHLVGADGVSNPEYIKNNQWELDEEYAKVLAISPACEIYVDDKELSPDMLERMYTGYEVYAVTEEVFGRETAVKISVKRGAEMTYSNAVTKVDHTLGEMELMTRDNFDITKATIVLKDGLLVPAEQIKARDTVFVAAESPMGGYDKKAMFVKVTTAHEKLFDGIRIGAIEGVSPSYVTLANHTSIINNNVDQVNPHVSGKYKLTTRSLIRDISDKDKIKTIKPEKFYHDEYSRTENYDKKSGLKYKRYYAFMVVNPLDNSIIAMNMRKGGLMPRNLFDYKLKKEEDIKKELTKTFRDAVVTRGLVCGRDATWHRLELTETHDYTNYTGRWTATNTNIYVKYSDAIVIKNGRAISIDDVKMGDYVYILRIGTDSLVIFVE